MAVGAGVVIGDHDALVAQFAPVQLRHAVLGVLHRRHAHHRRQVAVRLQVHRYVRHLSRPTRLINGCVPRTRR